MLGAEEVKVDGVNITQDLWGSLADIFRTELANAESEQKKLMEAEKRVSNGERKNLPFGRLRFKICPEVYHFWGGKLGYECWKDKSFLDWLDKRFGDLVRIRSKSANLAI